MILRSYLFLLPFLFLILGHMHPVLLLHAVLFLANQFIKMLLAEVLEGWQGRIYTGHQYFCQGKTF